MMILTELKDRYFTAFEPQKIHPTDIVEIIIIAFLIYEVMVWIKQTRAWMLFKGIAIILVFVLIAAIFHMDTILWLAERVINAAVIGLVVIFQPELRSALEQLGRKRFLSSLFAIDFSKSGTEKFSEKTINELVKACYEMGKVKTGALIVIEDEIVLTEYERTGIALDSLVSSQLLINIFEKNTPLHDGAVIVSGDRVVAATCYLPLSDNKLDKNLGTRHRAGVGISEVTDSLTIIVSEETGKISIAYRGVLDRDVNPDELRARLVKLQDKDMGDHKGILQSRKGKDQDEG